MDVKRPNTENEKTVNISATLESIRRKLLDLTKRNKLLNFRHNKQAIYIVDEQPNQVFQRMAIQGKAMVFRPLPEPENLDEEELEDSKEKRQSTETKDDLIEVAALQAGIKVSLELPVPTEDETGSRKKHQDRFLQSRLFLKPLETRLRRIASSARSVIEETGQNQLFLALGFLEWREDSASERTHKAPLILMPVELERGRLDPRSKSYDFSVKYSGEDLIPNLTLVEKLKQEFGLVLPAFEDESVTTGENGDASLDPEKYFKAVSSVVSEMRGWSVRRQMVLGFFTFSKLLMYLDLDPERWRDDKAISEHGIVKDLLEGRELSDPDLSYEDNVDDESHLESLPVVLDADSSQFEAIKEAINGKSMVIEGPPGTGKSQTITNLITAFLDQKKSVLFVAEKMAALDVVRRNLNKVNLGDFCLELHSHKAQKRRVLADIDRRRQRRFKDVAELDQELKQLRQTREPLKEYVDLLNSTVGPNGESIFDIFWKVEAFRATLGKSSTFLIDNAGAMTSNEISERVEVLQELHRYVSDIGIPKENPWYGYYPVKLFYGKEETITKTLSLVRDISSQLTDKVSNAMSNLEIKGKGSDLTPKQIHGLITLNPTDTPKLIIANMMSSFLLSSDEAADTLIKELKTSIHLYRKKVNEAQKVLSDPENLPDNDLQSLQISSTKINEYGLSGLTFLSLQDLSLSINRLAKTLDQIDDLTKGPQALGVEAPQSVSDLERFAKIDTLVRQKTYISEIEIKERLFSSENYTVFKEADQKATELNQVHDHLNKVFVLADVPSMESLTDVRRVLRLKMGKLFSIFSSEYRHAKKTLLTFLREPSLRKSRNVIDLLEKLQSHLTATREFEENKIYQDILGSSFKGMSTDWTRLRELFTWATELRNNVGSKQMAIKLGSLSNEDLSSWSDEGELPRALETIKAETKTLSERLPFETLTTNEKSYDEISTVRLQSSIKSLVGIIGPFIRTAEPVICSKEATVGSIHQAVTDQIEANEIAQKVGKEKGYQNLLGDYFQGIQTELEPVLEMVQWLKTIHSLKLPVPFMQALIQDSHGVIGTFHNFSDKWKKDLQAIEESFHLLSEFGEMKSEFFDGRSFHDVSMGSIQKRVNVALGSMNNILRWADYCRLVQQGENNGLAMLMESLATGDLPSEQAEDMFLFTVYDSIAQRLVQEHEVLSTFTRHRHEERRKKFVQLDKRILELSRERIAYHASRTRPPMGIGRGPIRTWTESALLDREINKTMRHIPIRRLLERAGKAIKALKPCFMMSPMSVAQFLEPGEHEFDVVIMDEASQLKPHEALGAVARAKQAIIVGDPKQLPPTTFFDAMADNLEEQEEETSIDDTESILDSCMTVKFPTTRLKWHYRSEHESLIAFSNSEWYDNDLIIFPSPDDSQTDLGIQFHYIEDAKYASQKNLKEAEYVAQAIIDHGKRNSGLSLGVGTFNLQQKNLIEDLVEKLRKEGPANDTAVENLLANETEPLFIKNLENLQGDERDVIYISCTYGPDVETGKIYQRFGPINGRNGSRRLNVMFTRAKKRMEIFSSMQPEDVIGGPKSSLGANALKRFLRYASSGQITEAGEITNREPDSDFEIAVAKVLKQHGYEIKPQVGVAGFFIDIGICHPDREGEFIVGIECDGAAYHSARSARDRDRLREEVLLRRGWRIYRIWSTDWFKNRDVEIDRLLKTLAKYREEDSHVVRTKEKAAITVPKEHKIERQSGQELRARLLEYRRENITPRETSPSDGVLRNDLLLALVEMRPTSLDEFQERIPSQLRENIYSDERQFLDDIFSIIETSIDG